MQDDGKLNTSDDPAIVFGCLDSDFILKVGLLHMVPVGLFEIL